MLIDEKKREHGLENNTEEFPILSTCGHIREYCEQIESGTLQLNDVRVSTEQTVPREITLTY